MFEDGQELTHVIPFKQHCKLEAKYTKISQKKLSMRPPEICEEQKRGDWGAADYI